MRRSAVALLTVVSLASSAIGDDDRLKVHKDPEDPSRFICDVGHAMFTTPKGWRPNRSNGVTRAILSRSDETYPKLSRMISIDVGKPTKKTAKETAEAFARRWDGKVAERTVIVHGEQGYRVRIPADAANESKVTPRDCIVVMRNDQVFLLIGGAVEDVDVSKALDELVATWMWTDQSDDK